MESTLTASPWSENPVHRLRELITEGFSASEAAATLTRETGQTFTRDSAKQKARTLGLSFKGKAGRPVGVIETGERPSRSLDNTHKQREGLDWRRRVSLFVLRPQPLPLEQLRWVPAQGEPTRFDDCGGCVWPVSGWLEPGSASTPVCNGTRARGKPYCGAHSAIAYTPAPARVA